MYIYLSAGQKYYQVIWYLYKACIFIFSLLRLVIVKKMYVYYSLLLLAISSSICEGRHGRPLAQVRASRSVEQLSSLPLDSVENFRSPRSVEQLEGRETLHGGVSLPLDSVENFRRPRSVEQLEGRETLHGGVSLPLDSVENFRRPRSVEQ